MKKFLSLLFWSILVIALIVTAFYINKSYKQLSIQEIDVRIEYNGGDSLLYEEDIRDVLVEILDTVVGKKIEDIDLDPVRDAYNLNPYISSVEIYPTLLGNLKVEIIQRRPLLRIVNALNKSYYISTDGKLMPMYNGHPIRILIASGHISDRITRDVLADYSIMKDFDVRDSITILKDLYNISNYIKDDNFFDIQIGQIYISATNEIEMVPNVGKHLILFGDGDRIPEKFNKLKEFYEQGINKAGWDTYKELDLRYNNQVVGSK